MDTNFIVVIPFHNARPFLSECAQSLVNQEYKTWRAVFADDASTDDGIREIPTDPRFTIVRSEKRLTALENIHNTIISANPKPEDVICLLDGDDYLIRNDALWLVASLYERQETMLTYGQYVWPNNMVGHCRPYTKETFASLRSGGYWASHMRTFKFKLYQEMMTQDPDLSCFKDKSGLFYRTCYDVAIMTPLMEIAGLTGIAFNPYPIYMYRQHPNNDHVVDRAGQKRAEVDIFSKRPFLRLVDNDKPKI
jgi:glycosyltransferase involved in cell wall biosynthesis